MNGKKARAARRALRRSQDSVFARKVERSAATETQKDYNALATILRKQRDDALSKINEEFRQQIALLENARREARQKTWDTYDAERKALAKKFAEREAQAA